MKHRCMHMYFGQKIRYLILLFSLTELPLSNSFIQFNAEVAEWRKQKILTPAKRGRKPGSGKKNIIKAATGKVVYVSVDISRYANGTVLLQVQCTVVCGKGCGCVYAMGNGGEGRGWTD